MDWISILITVAAAALFAYGVLRVIWRNDARINGLEERISVLEGGGAPTENLDDPGAGSHT